MSEELWLALAGEPVRVVSSVPDVVGPLSRAYVAFAREPGADAWVVDIGLTPNQLIEIQCGDGSTSRTNSAWSSVSIVDHLLRARFVAAATPDRLVLHAAAVADPRGAAALLVAPSKTGKSSLATALTALGWTLLGDELVAIGPRAALQPFPRLPELERDMADKLVGRWPVLSAGVEQQGRSVFVSVPEGMLSRPDAVHPVRAVVFLERHPRSGPPKWSHLPGGDAVLQLVRSSFNGELLGSAVIDIATDIASAARTRTLSFDDVLEQAEQISAELESLIRE